jgi:uncharacterized membrane protein HdeD (DUF308 family)
MNNYRFTYLLEAFLLISLGVFALVSPHFFTIGMERLLGWSFILAGVAQSLRIFKGKLSVGRSGYIFNAILYVICGIWLLKHQQMGLLSMTLVLMIFFITEGLAKFILGYQLHPIKRWHWFIVDGIFSWAMALFIWNGWPDVAYWVPGVFTGINLLSYGCSLLAFSFRTYHVTPEVN